MGNIQSIDAKTGKVTKTEKEFIASPSTPDIIEIDLKEVDKLIKYAKTQGWI